MKSKLITHCPGMLIPGHESYSRACLTRMFNGRQVSHILDYANPNDATKNDNAFQENQQRISISGVQVKFSIVLVKNKLRLSKNNEQGTHILKPIPRNAKYPEELPANEHLTMQIARQVYQIETAKNAMIFFKDGTPAYITKRFDIDTAGQKLAVEDFSSLAGKTPQTHGEHYKYSGNYLNLFRLAKTHLPAYAIEAPKLFRLILFNYLFSNGDAHLKNFSVIETGNGDFKLSPAYDLLNSKIHVNDTDFALDEGLLPKHMAKGTVMKQFIILAKEAGLREKNYSRIINELLSNSPKVKQLIESSFMSESKQRNYLQAFQTRLKKLKRG